MNAKAPKALGAPTRGSSEDADGSSNMSLDSNMGQ